MYFQIYQIFIIHIIKRKYIIILIAYKNNKDYEN